MAPKSVSGNDAVVTDWNQLAQGAFEALPGVKGNRADFAAVLAKQADEGVYAADLLLAWATLKKDPVATRELDRRLVQAVRMTVGRFDTQAPFWVVPRGF